MADDAYGFPCQPTPTHGTHRYMPTTTVIPHNTKQAAQVLAQNADLLAAMEARLGAPSYVAWLDERQRLVGELRELEAKYGDGGTWKEYRDNLFALIAVEKRAELEANAPIVKDSKGVEKPRPVTEAMVEEAVRTDERFTDFTQGVQDGKVAYITTKNQVDDIQQLLFWASALVKRSGMLEPAESHV